MYPASHSNSATQPFTQLLGAAPGELQSFTQLLGAAPGELQPFTQLLGHT